MMFPAKTVLLLLAAALCGCVSESERAMRDEGTCLSWGTPFGSEGYANCMVLLRETRALEAERDNARVAAFGRALEGFGDAYRGSGTAAPPSFGEQIYRDAVRDSMQRASQGLQSLPQTQFICRPFVPGQTVCDRWP